MTVRFYIALAYGALALGATAFSDQLPSAARAAHVYQATIETAAAGRPAVIVDHDTDIHAYTEDDDLPAYLTDFEGNENAD